MIQLQIISKILETGSLDILTDNNITPDYFVGYELEVQFLLEHLTEFGNVPDKATFLSKFTDFELVEVNESDKYLVDTIREEFLYYKSIPVLQKAADLLKSDSIAACEYMVHGLKELENIQNGYDTKGIDIISQAQDRYEQYQDKKQNQDNWFFTTGFEELDDIIHGLRRGEELCVIFARINNGKSWTIEKICTHIWQLGFNVGYVSPEMSASSVGYRFDTLNSNFSNKALMWGKELEDENKYTEYIENLKTRDNKFIVATPKDFDSKITVSKLRTFVTRNELDVLAVDGIKYLTDERYVRGDNLTKSLTNISEDLMQLSIDLNIPVIVVVQANRGGVIDKEQEGTPDLEHIRDSDGIGANASLALAVRVKDNILELGIKKQRFGAVGGKLMYHWNPDIGDYQFIPSYTDAEPKERTERKVKETRNKFKDKANVF